MKRLVVPGIPFLLSFALSLSTAGSHVYWQDSGFFLVAVKELGVLYPPGFALYVLLCKAWTLALWGVDFTYAVHLFSAVCAALAAGTLAVAARDLLRTRGPLFHTVQEEGPLAEWVGVCIGCLAASGYTFWAAAILAKVYAFYYLILALLIWRMIRADESGKPRDFTWVAVLIGLAWQAHPSATNAGLALFLFAAFHRRAVGWKGMSWRTGLAALCAVGPVHLLPLMARSGSVLQFGDPSTVEGFFSYVLGRRFTAMEGAFGLDGSRVASVFRYGWEEFLGVGLIAVGAGSWRLWQGNRRLLAGIAAWVVPVLVVTVLFKLEGQHDHWMVAAWIPLWLVAAVGLCLVGKGREIAVALALIGVAWAVIANRKDLDQRDYMLVETFGEYYLSRLNVSELTLSSDDALASTLFLQRVRSPGQYDHVRIHSSSGGIAKYNAGPGRLAPPSADCFYSDFLPKTSWVGEGPLYRQDTTSTGTWGFLDNWSSWQEPIAAEDLPKLFRRPRGQFVERVGEDLRVRAEPYEKRFLRVLLLVRRNRAKLRSSDGQLSEAESLYESILALDPWTREDPSVLIPLAVVEVGLKKYARAEELFKSALTCEIEPEKRAEACYFLAALTGDKPEGAEWKTKALASPDLAPELRAKLEGR